MLREEDIKQELEARFSFLLGKVSVKRQRRIYVDTPFEYFSQVFDYAIRHLGFADLITITGLDEGEDLGVIYHLAGAGGLVLNMKTHIPKDNPRIKTVTAQFPSADIYERELMDLLGFEVEGLAAGLRYPLADNWPLGEFPLRKDWKGHSPGRNKEA